jgi:hypothetical protein
MHRALVGCAVAASTAVVLTAAPSLAQSRTTPDGTGDVWSQGGVVSRSTHAQVRSLLAGHARGVSQPQPAERVNTDLVKTKVNHTATEVTATATYADLVRNTDSFEYVMLLKNNDRQKFWVFVGATPDDRNGAMSLTSANGDKVKCGGKDFAVSYAQDKISLSIPRSCLGKPRWVKYESAAITFDEANNSFIDDAASDQAQPSQWSAKLHRN